MAQRSFMAGVLSGLDPKPGELPMARLKPR